MKRNALLASLMISSLGIAGCSNGDSKPEDRTLDTSAKYEEGTHYRDIGEPIEALTADVTEFFWYGCPHCNTFRKPIDKFTEENPDISVGYRHSALSKGWIQDAALHETMSIIGLGKDAQDAMFDHIHEGGDRSRGTLQVFQDAGIDVQEEDFELSTDQAKQVTDNLTETIKMERQIKARGVPYLVVNGEFLMNSGAFESREELLDAAKWLVKNK